jgi:L-threonylcarbamoyladenylate synthase
MKLTTRNLCKIVAADNAGLEEAVARLRAGSLVAFPTETVYGLGASALNAEAVASIFLAKGRPFSDPLIVHVSGQEMAEDLCVLSAEERKVFESLTEAFWPGPLTLVVPAGSNVPSVVTGGGRTVGLRLPSHPVAQALIKRSGLPLAAPSANRFGHVSPTKASHVACDLSEWPLLVLDGGSCQVGIESTVARIVSADEVAVLRRGAISIQALREVLEKSGLRTCVRIQERVVVATTEAMASPGQLLIHYAPSLPAFLISKGPSQNKISETFLLENCALVDIGQQFLEFSGISGKYVDLSVSGSVNEACEKIFSVLRILEKLDGIKAILLPDLSNLEDEMALALADRLNRAAAFKKAVVINSSVQVVS